VDGDNCVVSPNFLPDRCTLVHGNELLGRTDPSYGNINVRRFRERAHTLEAVWDVLQQTSCELPLNWNPPPKVQSSTDVFVGYLLLDAVIGNTDRHHENWGIVEEPEEATARRHLAPTFDHASCLGCHLTDMSREARLGTRDRRFTVEAYAEKARSAFFPDNTAPRPMSTIDAFRRGAVQWPKAARVWKQKLQAIQHERLDEMFSAIPQHRCSEVSREFARRILLHNIRVNTVAANQ
jgi:hypothetical protein